MEKRGRRFGEGAAGVRRRPVARAFLVQESGAAWWHFRAEPFLGVFEWTVAALCGAKIGGGARSTGFLGDEATGGALGVPQQQEWARSEVRRKVITRQRLSEG